MAETTNFMVAGYSVIFGVMGLYVISLVVRMRNLRAQERMLDEMEKTQE